MHRFRNLKIRAHVALMSAILVVGFAVLGGIFASSVYTLLDANTLLGNTQNAMREASEFLRSASDMERDVMESLSNDGPEGRVFYLEAADSANHHLRSLHSAVADPKLRAPMDPVFADLIAQMGTGFQNWQTQVAEPFLNSTSVGDPKELRKFLEQSEPLMENIRNNVNEFQNKQQRLNYQRGQRASSAAEFAMKTAVFGTVLTLLIVLLGFSMLSRAIVEPLLHLKDMSERIAEGDYTQRAWTPGKNEVGSLANAFNDMAENLDRANKEQIATRTRMEALNRLASQTARSPLVKERAEAVLKTLREEFGATAGRIFLPDATQGWSCVEITRAGRMEHQLYLNLPDKYQSVMLSHQQEQKPADEGDDIQWSCPLQRADRTYGVLWMQFPPEEWDLAQPLLNSINRFCTNSFELARVYEDINGERQRLDAILNSTGEGVLVREQTGRISLANPSVLRILNLEDRKVQGLPLGEVLGGETFAELRRFIEAASSGSGEPEESGAIPLGDRYLAATRAPIRDVGMVGTVVVIRDITQQVEVDRMKSEFISIVSHELRTPLTSIKGSLGLLLGGMAGGLPAKMEQLLQIAQNNTDRLIRLINDILDISKIEAGRVQMARESVDIADVVHAAREGLDSMAQAAQVQIVSTVPVSGSLEVVGDRDRLLQVVTNLVSNAVKFSPPQSKVEIQVRAQDHALEVSVIDQGPGILPEHQEKLFQKFYQVDSSSTRAKSGTGLGLAISQAIIKEHHGLIDVESTVGRGSRFWFALPLANRKMPIFDEETTGGPRVLVCDDDRDIANLIAMLLEQRGYASERVYSGTDVLKRVKERHYDLITLDLSMPEMDGMEVARKLQEDPETRDIPVVFVTAHEKSLVSSSLQTAGWIQKPIDESVLQETIRAALSLGGDGEERVSDREKPLVLLVDDDPDVLQIVGEMVASAGMQVIQARGGSEALKKIREEKPDALVLDIMMPGLDGFDVVRTLRQSKKTHQIPILVLSAKDDLTEEERGRLKLGETRFLTKSYASQQAILEDLSKLLQGDLVGSA